MLRYIITKIFNKYKLYLCLMVGNIAIIMIFAMIMMFREGSRAKLIQRGFTSYQEKTHKFPMTLYRQGSIKLADIEALSEDAKVTDLFTKEEEAYEASWNKYINLPIINTERIVTFRNAECEYSYGGKGHIDFGYIEEGLGGTGADLSEHYNLSAGADLYGDISEYTDTGCEIPDNAIPCLISQFTADYLNLVPGETINFYKLIYGGETSDEPLITLYINGIITEKPNDYFWQVSLADCGFMAILDKQDFENIVKKYPKENMCYDLYMSFDYRYLRPGRVDDIDSILRQFSKKDESLKEDITPIIRDYRKNSKSVEQMLYVIVLPLIVLVLIFIGMISFRIIDSEDGELTTLKNRGLSKARLIGMYVIQSFILAGVSLPIGLLVGFLFGKMVAGVTDFMGFSFGASSISVRDYRFNILMVASGAVGALIAVVIMLLPVLLYFKKKRNRRKSSSTPGWEKYFIDVALLCVSVYLLYNYNKQVGTLSKGVLNGEGIDPIIFINSTLFLFACGMLMLRIIFYMVKLVYKMGAKKFKPVTYAGFLQIMRTRKASSIISIFLVMTVAMSLFNANMARTINRNKEERTKYSCGADIRIKEHWVATIVGPPEDRKWKFNEPDFDVYQKMVEDGTFTAVTKVLISDRAILKVSGKETPDVTLMGVHTKEFGQVAFLRDGITDEHWYNYLNDLAVETDGVIISKNLADLFDLKVGDKMQCDMRPPKQIGLNDAYAKTDFKVVAITDAWPGYNKYKYEYVEVEGGKTKLVEKENYLAVVNYGSATSHFNVLPYEVWASTEDGVKMTDELKEKFKTSDGTTISSRESDIVNAMLKQGYTNPTRYTDSVTSWRDSIKDEKSSAIIQITNGLFTADFLIALILCIIGYMIYWITSIRDRELLFGIYRAMGISRGEINSMLGMEQVFLSLMSIFAGVLAGTLASKFFVRVFAAVYLPEKHNMGVFTSSYGGDLIKLAATLLIVVLVCIFWIRRIVRGLNITEALKLGDD
ncbi:MAG: ABC transporter permease [Eubacterium sp.]|nr:ABC transporter permease [Eubacterium sp.]